MGHIFFITVPPATNPFQEYYKIPNGNWCTATKSPRHSVYPYIPQDKKVGFNPKEVSVHSVAPLVSYDYSWRVSTLTQYHCWRDGLETPCYATFTYPINISPQIWKNACYNTGTMRSSYPLMMGYPWSYTNWGYLRISHIGVHAFYYETCDLL